MYSDVYLCGAISVVAAATNEHPQTVAKWFDNAWARVRDHIADDMTTMWARNFDMDFHAMRAARKELTPQDFAQMCEDFRHEVDTTANFDDSGELWYLGELCKVAYDKGVGTADSAPVYIGRMVDAFLMNTAYHAGIHFDNDPADLFNN